VSGDSLQCAMCLFCAGITSETVRCTNADLASEGQWEQIYLVQGFLEFPHPDPKDPPCFWFVHKR